MKTTSLETKPLFDELTAQMHAPDHVVAFQDGEPRTWRHWLGNVQSLRGHLDGRDGGYWPLFFTDTYEFSVALFALWSTQRVPVLLPDASAHTLERLPAHTGGFLGELPQTLPGYVDWQNVDSPEPVEDLRCALTCTTALSTSGSTGDALMIEKTPAQLIGEVACYYELWGSDMQSCTFLATVSHQHIYGLLFRLLLPMALGRPFLAEMLSNPRNVLQRSAEHEAAVWVASPAQLKRTHADIIRDLSTANVQFIFSSGGLLEAPAAASIEALFAQPAFEVYGSTETGGIAYRQQYQAKHSNPWTPLPNVDIRCNDEGLLEVCSAYTQNHWMTTGDRAELLEANRFTLLGRADRIVKLEEKRVSLTATERELAALDAVDQARLVVLPGKRAQLAAVIVPSPAGVEALTNLGRNAVVQSLRKALLARLDSHAVPRRMRFVHELPTTTQGKVRAVDLQALFEHGERNVLPIVTAVNIPAADGEPLTLDLRVPADLDYFAGHFEGFAVVPGVVQLLWARHYARLHLGFSGDVQNMSQVKFKSMLRPGQAVTLTLNMHGGQLRFRYAADGREFSSGRLQAEHV